jgi:hypothetical protein
VQFGEGGAGTFSDGKLWSQIKDPRHLGREVMQTFVEAGAPPEILVDAQPHIGTFKLVKVVENLREQIIALGGEVRFEQRVTDVRLIRGATMPRAEPSACKPWPCWTSRPAPTMSCPPGRWCWHWGTARATPLPCCTRAACSWRPSRFRLVVRIEHRRA